MTCGVLHLRRVGFTTKVFVFFLVMYKALRAFIHLSLRSEGSSKQVTSSSETQDVIFVLDLKRFLCVTAQGA